MEYDEKVNEGSIEKVFLFEQLGGWWCQLLRWGFMEKNQFW